MAEVQAEPLLAQVLAQLRRDVRIEAVEHAGAAHEHVDPAAQRLQHRAQLHRDVAAADDRHPRGRRGQREKAIGVDAKFRARNVRPPGMSTRREQQLRRAQHDAVVAGHHARRLQAAAHRHQCDTGLVQPLQVTLVDVADVALAEGDEGRPVQARRNVRQVEAHLFRDRQPVRQVRRQPHRLLRHAADVDAGAAQFARLQQRHARAVLRRAEGAGEPAGAATDHHQVEISAHGATLPQPGRIRTPVWAATKQRAPPVRRWSLRAHRGIRPAGSSGPRSCRPAPVS